MLVPQEEPHLEARPVGSLVTQAGLWRRWLVRPESSLFCLLPMCASMHLFMYVCVYVVYVCASLCMYACVCYSGWGTL